MSTLSESAARRLAERLLDEHRRGRPFQPLAELPMDAVDDAYRVQREYVRLRQQDQPSAVAGYKIGLTSSAMQAMCGIDSPVYGSIFADTVYPSGVELACARFQHPGIEFEIAVRLRDTIPPDRELTLREIAAVVDGISPALELIEDRYADYGRLNATSLVADNSWSAGIVLGDWQPLVADLPERSGRIRLDGLEIDAGRVGDALDHPLASVAWLAEQLRRRGQSLAAGAIVMTGNIVRTRFPAPGQDWEYEVDGLGSVRMRFS
ncbi:MAG: fumarylacetoacetate hydrolase family protein [Chloroflexi bacterium]|nr:fumarylacetoacetate hydrolase family protein [Chloroflexota bacterium]